MEVVVEVVLSRAQRGESHPDGLPWRHRNLTIELETFELDRFLAGIDDLDNSRLMGWQSQSLRGETMILESNVRRRAV